jgi:Glycosyl transferase family 2.
MRDTAFLVRVYCVTFNQSSYILDTLNGFCMQETNFPFICTIIDDASTDGEREVIMNFLQKFFVFENENNIICEENDDYIRYFAQHKTNNNCYFNVFLLKYNHYCIKKSKLSYDGGYNGVKYMAFCEGDDYWVNPLKLQKQVDFLEEHDDYTMVHTAYYRYYQNSGKRIPVILSNEFSLDNDGVVWDIITGDMMIGTATVLVNSLMYNKINSDYAGDFQNAMMTDVQTWFHCARLSKIQYIPELTAVYRKNDGGLTAINTVKRFYFLKNAFEIHLGLATKYDAPSIIVKKILDKYGNAVISTGIDNCMYKELVAFCKKYLPKNKKRIMVFRIARLLPVIDKRIVRRLTLK